MLNSARSPCSSLSLITGSAKECQLLANAVWKSLIEIRIQPFIQRSFYMSIP